MNETTEAIVARLLAPLERSLAAALADLGLQLATSEGADADTSAASVAPRRRGSGEAEREPVSSAIEPAVSSRAEPAASSRVEPVSSTIGPASIPAEVTAIDVSPEEHRSIASPARGEKTVTRLRLGARRAPAGPSPDSGRQFFASFGNDVNREQDLVAPIPHAIGLELPEFEERPLAGFEANEGHERARVEKPTDEPIVRRVRILEGSKKDQFRLSLALHDAGKSIARSRPLPAAADVEAPEPGRILVVEAAAASEASMLGDGLEARPTLPAERLDVANPVSAGVEQQSAPRSTTPARVTTPGDIGTSGSRVAVQPVASTSATSTRATLGEPAAAESSAENRSIDRRSPPRPVELAVVPALEDSTTSPARAVEPAKTGPSELELERMLVEVLTAAARRHGIEV